ncbi:serine hydrolase domain-containing protein [Ructibacterium gallinarum]|uniref:Beta-lactamase family protein n=1 Tax=Ructibacterium gallinarum TaxID=2779355 RepID=A0A9D5M6T8_9FIRM|nr:serine hydrolase domain-containing protein [Ructibacterium gallinarum]MBE5040577.1 beta-lactamase family protein [Ructibacterium gallinarum]
MWNALTNYLDQFLDLGIPGFDCIVYCRGRETYRHFNGFRDAEHLLPVDGTESYYIYSASKPITCTAALQLYEKGEFRLDDPLYLYLPEFKDMYIKENGVIRKAKKQITIENLFCMTSGLSYNVYSPSLKRARIETNGACPTRETMKYLAEESLEFEPGEKWLYGLSHDVLAAVVEVVSGKRFSTYLAEHIFEPLGMTNTSFSQPRNDKMMLQYDMSSGALLPVDNGILKFKIGSEYESGGAGCVSTVEDYIKFCEALRIDDYMLKRETVELMSRNHLNAQCLSTYNWETIKHYGYGLGVRCPLSDGKRTDFGWGGMAGAFLGIDRKNKFSVFYAQQVANSPVQKVRSNLIDFVSEAIKYID